MHYTTGSSITPPLDTAGSVHMARLKQQGRRMPDFSFERATPIRFLRVSELLVARIQRTQSQRAIAVVSFQVASDLGALFRAAWMSGGISGSGQVLEVVMLTFALSPGLPFTSNQ